MDHIKVLKRAWETTWRYRALWIFGIIVALTTASGGGDGGGGGGDGNGGNGRFQPPGDFPWLPREFTWPEIPSHITNALIIVGISVACVIIFLVIVAIVARYVAETALIRMVNDHEETGEQRSIREGFRMGWSRTAWRLFLISLLIGLPTFVAFFLLFLLPAGLIFLSVLALEQFGVVLGVIGIVAGVGLSFLILFLAIVVVAVLTLLRRFFWRACALEKLGVIDSIREGFGVVRRHLMDVGIMWLIMIGIRIGWVIAMIAITIVLFPVILLLIIIGGLLGGVPALLVWGLTSLFLGEPWPYILAGVIGLPIFILVMAAPWVFLGGLMEVFKSSTWTLTYRELRALEGLETEMEIETEIETEIEVEAEEWSELDEPGSESLPDSL